MRQLATVLALVGVIGPFASVFKAQEAPKEAPKQVSKEIPKELPRGKWTGTRTPNNNNANAQNVTFELNSFSDPLTRWRIGPAQFFTAALIVNAQQKFELSDMRLEGENLSFVIEQPQPNQLQCTLTKQKDGSYAGNCPRIRDKQAGFKVTMIPPKEAPAPAAK